MRKVGVGLAILLVMVALSACSSGPETKPPRTTVATDTDVGSDDVMAILHLLSRPDVDVRAITVSGTGLVPLRAGGANGSRAARGRRGTRRAGRVRPRDATGGSNAFPKDWRAAADDAFGLVLPEASGVADERGAPRS